MTDAPLKHIDRCCSKSAHGLTDRCGSRARVRVHFASNGGALDFCAMHYRAVADSLGDVRVQDESQRIQDEEDKREGVG